MSCACRNDCRSQQVNLCTSYLCDRILSFSPHNGTFLVGGAFPDSSFLAPPLCIADRAADPRHHEQYSVHTPVPPGRPVQHPEHAPGRLYQARATDQARGAAGAGALRNQSRESQHVTVWLTKGLPRYGLDTTLGFRTFHWVRTLNCGFYYWLSSREITVKICIRPWHSWRDNVSVKHPPKAPPSTWTRTL